MKLIDVKQILMDTVRFGENLTQHKNLSIGLYGLSQNLRDGVND